jgi:hypothetical protein
MSPSFTSGGPVAVLGTRPCPHPQALGVLKSLSSLNTEISPLPSRFPLRLEGELAWSGSDFTDESSYVYNLTEADILELGAGLVHFKGQYLS